MVGGKSIFLQIGSKVVNCVVGQTATLYSLRTVCKDIWSSVVSLDFYL